MATAEEILETMSDEEEQSVLVIDNDLRTIRIPEDIRILGVESDANVRRLDFIMPRMYHDVDLSTFVIRINYSNANSEGDIYPVKDASVNDQYISFSWLVGRSALRYRGNVKFIVCLKEYDGDVIAKEFNTTPATLSVLEGLEPGKTIVDDYPDIIESMLLRLDALEKGGSTGGGSNINDTAPSATTTYSSQKIEAELKTLKEAIGKKLDASELPTAINTALTQAKESGEFKGDPGAPGAKGDPGEDYVLTEADKEEIAEMAAELVEVPEGSGGSYTLPIANKTTLGGVKPEAKTEAMNQPVGVDANGRLYAPAAALPTDEQVGSAVDVYLTKNGVKCNDVWVDAGTITVAEGEAPTQLVWNLDGAIKKYYMEGTTKGHSGSGNLQFVVRTGTGTVPKITQKLPGNGWTAGTTSTIYVKAEAEEKANGWFWCGVAGNSTFAGPPGSLVNGEEGIGTDVKVLSIGAYWNNQAFPVGTSFNLKVVYK